MYRTGLWTLWEKARMGCFKRTASKHVYYRGWNRPPAQVGCMRQVLGAGVLGSPRGMGWGGRLEGGLGWGTHENPWLIHVNVWDKPLQYCKVISLQLIKINGKKQKVKLNLFLVQRGWLICSIFSFQTPQLSVPLWQVAQRFLEFSILFWKMFAWLIMEKKLRKDNTSWYRKIRYKNEF